MTRFLDSVLRNYIRVGTTALIIVLCAGEARAQLPRLISDSSSVSILTTFPGAPVYSAWGHSAMRIQDPDSGIDAVFSYGTFDPSRPYFISRFAYGDMLYEISVEPMTRFMRKSEIEQRDVVEQVLHLDAEATTRMWTLLMVNLREENKSYLYDFVYDNCSTRLIDLLEATESITLPSQDPYSATFREMLDEYIHNRALLDLGIDLVLGSKLDTDPDVRARTFLPVYLMDILDVSTSYDGSPLVREKRMLAEYGARPDQSGLPRTIPFFWTAALALLAFTAKGYRDKTLTEPGRLDRWLLGVIGFAGLFLMVMWFFTHHTLTALNWNVAWALPTHFLVAVLWKRIPHPRTYLRYTSYWTMAMLALQFVLPQSIPPPMLPVVIALAIRMWVVSR